MCAAQTLRSLERDGLVLRTATPTVPVTVTYGLTDLGRSLHEVVREVKAWAEGYLDDVLARRRGYDDAAGGEPPARPASTAVR